MLLTKLHIPLSGKNSIPRLTLFENLNEGFKRKLILVSAPAGFGKSTILSDWINNQKIPTGWFSVDSNDNDPVDFLSYIISAIQGIKENFGQNISELLKSPNPPNPESVINILINEILKIEKDFLIVFDDFHLINNSEIIKLIGHLIEYIPPKAHIAILTRSDPSLPLARLRSQHQLLELRSSDLSFTADEISNLFNKKLKLNLSSDDIELLEAKTEGWIAGLQLTALSMSGRDDVSAFIKALKGDNRYIMDYLIEEVLKIQSENTKDFLLQTSLLEQISAPLCNFLLERNDCQLILEELERSNMFVIPLDDERHWYRYHHLFADLLRQKLLLKNKTNADVIHNKACEWFEKNNMNELAIEHALKVHNFEKSLQILNKIVEGMWESGLHSAIVKYGDLLPDDLIKENLNFSLYYAWILISAGNIDKGEVFLKSSYELSLSLASKEYSESTNYSNILSGKISIAFAYLYTQKEVPEEIFTHCKQGMDHLDQNELLWNSWAWYSMGVAYYLSDQLDESITALNNGLVYCKKSGNIYQISTIAIKMAEIDQQLGRYKSAYKRCTELLDFIKQRGYLQITKAEWTYAALYFIMGISQFIWSDMEKAFENIKIAYDLSKDGKDLFLRAYILMVYSAILHETGADDANNKIDELEELLKDNTLPPILDSMHVGWKIYIHLKRNQIEQVNKILVDYGFDPNHEKTHFNEGVYSSYARFLLAQNRLDEAKPIISELYTLASEGKRIERIIDLKVAHAIYYRKKGEREKATQALIEAMEMASKENLFSFFVFSKNDIEDILPNAYSKQATSTTQISNEFISGLKIAFEKVEKLKKSSSENELSNRELDTLKLIAENLTNQQVADKLFISLNTVKTHLKNIYLKLDVDSRAKAIAKAKDTGII